MSQHGYGLDGRERPLAPVPVGEVAPDFALPQVAVLAPRGSLLELRRVARRQALVLVFYPTNWEPVSREQLMLYQAFSDAFARLGAHVLGISCDHLHSHDAFAHDAHIQFPLLADFQPYGWVASQYGVFRMVQGTCARALFVLDRQRVIRFSKVYPDALNPGVDELLTILEALAAAPVEKRTGRQQTHAAAPHSPKTGKAKRDGTT